MEEKAKKMSTIRKGHVSGVGSESLRSAEGLLTGKAI